jgi:hypothetical protein
MKDVQGTGEAFNPQIRTPALQNMTFLYFFYIFVCHICPPGSGSTDLIEFGSDPDPKHCFRLMY